MRSPATCYEMKSCSYCQLQDDPSASLWFSRPHMQTVLSASSEPLDNWLSSLIRFLDCWRSSSTICVATTVPAPSQSSSCSVQPTMTLLVRQIQELSLSC
ncbi:hypothetical protein TNCV_944701 [Trichonephila clavipes]|nr:hypothetical protein TNCV_944701 [Trichonephila clavipes]